MQFVVISFRKMLLVFIAVAFIVAAAAAAIAAATRSRTSLPSAMTRDKIIIGSITPEEHVILYEEEPRGICFQPEYSPSPIGEIQETGKSLDFTVLFDAPDYLRPLYDPAWKHAFYRGWLDLAQKNAEARHRLFIYCGGLSNIYDFTDSLGFEKNVPVDYHRNINFLIYHFDVKSIKLSRSQAVITGEPRRKGVQVVSVVQDALLPEGTDTMDFLFQLATPDGYELDYIYGSVIRYDYWKKKMGKQDEKPVSADTGTLKKDPPELSYYIPPDEKRVTQPDQQANFQPPKDAGREIPMDVKFNSGYYRRPVYHPLWKENYKKGWCYLPRQVQNNLHRLFVIPRSDQERADFFSTMAFFENYAPIESGETGLLVYNFCVCKAIAYEDELRLEGFPARKGVQVLAFDQKYFEKDRQYLIRLATPAGYETDFTVFKAE